MNENTQLITEEDARFRPPRLPYHPAIQERYGIDRSAWKSLVEAVWPGARSVDSVVMALSYCRARNLDPFKKPVHVVPVWDTNSGSYIETVWPGISELRTTAFRTGQYAGCDETEFGPNITKTFQGKVGKRGQETEKSVTLTFPEWGRMTVFRMLNGHVCRFVGPKVLWLESYASIGKSDLPNEMWSDRAVGQLEKCVEAAALRKAFPEECGNDLTAEEMEGRRMAVPSNERVEPLSAGNRDNEDGVVKAYKDLQAQAAQPERPKRTRAPKAPDPVTKAAEEIAQDAIPGEPEAEQDDNAVQLTNSDVVDETEETPNQEVLEDGPQDTQTEDAGSVTAQNGSADNSPDSEDSSGEMDGSGQTATNDASPSDAFKAFEAGIGQAMTWAEIDSVFMALFATDDWKYAEEWERRAVRVTMWERVATLRKETNTIIVDPRDNAKAFLCWLDCAKEGDEKEVNLLFGKLQATPTYKKFNDAQRAHIEAQVSATLERIGKKS